MSDAKIHPILRDVLALARAATTPEPIPIIIRYHPRREQPLAGLAAAANARPQRTFQLMPCIATVAQPDDIHRLAADPAVERIWYDLPVHALLDVSAPRIRANEVWAQGDEGADVRVAILDTGCDMSHPDLRDRVQASVDFSGKGDAQDGHGHGTHVAGIVAGTGAASDGKYRGIAPQAHLYIAKVLDDLGNGRTSDVMAGLDWAVEQKAQVINLSLGSDQNCDGTDALSEACDTAVSHGIVVVVAAGNNGPLQRTVGSPGCAHEVITIGASADDDAVANFSSRGPTSDGRVKPDVVLPGANIISARAADTTLGSGPINEYYTSLSGTSMATPHAAGVVALLLAENPRLTPHEIKEILKATAIDLELNLNTQGAGRVDAFAAWQQAKASLPPTPEPPPEPSPEPPPIPEPEPPEPPKPPSGCLNALPVALLALFRK